MFESVEDVDHEVLTVVGPLFAFVDHDDQFVGGLMLSGSFNDCCDKKGCVVVEDDEYIGKPLGIAFDEDVEVDGGRNEKELELVVNGSFVFVFAFAFVLFVVTFALLFAAESVVGTERRV